MDPGMLLAPRPCVKRKVLTVVYLLLGLPYLSETDSSCPCGEIPPVLRTKNPDQNCSIGKYRYTCEDGYVRKAGTSNLIRCESNKWSNASLVCIENPLDPLKNKTTTTTTTTTTTKTKQQLLQLHQLQTLYLPLQL
ncbi:hypothetical protein WMY93_021298 [Mugilogobius chulae]|uniref:Sushi domain-containing protein n=1 Tax=Mugilogobius chulae TaxID=88201 RepID=A0AAW0NAB8_9GOBI